MPPGRHAAAPLTLRGRGAPAVLLLGACLAAAGCAQGGEPPPADPGEAGRSVDEAAREADQEARETDARFKGSPFGSVVKDLPVGEPPLRVRQYVVDEGEHELTARVPAREFLCARDPDARLAAVASFYRSADRRFRARGVQDLELTVAVLTEDVDELRPLARARRGKVALTRRGRASDPC